MRTTLRRIYINYIFTRSAKNSKLEDSELSVAKPKKENYFIFLCILFVKRVESLFLRTKYVTQLFFCYLYFPVLEPFTSMV